MKEGMLPVANDQLGIGIGNIPMSTQKDAKRIMPIHRTETCQFTERKCVNSPNAVDLQGKV